MSETGKVMYEYETVVTSYEGEQVYMYKIYRLNKKHEDDTYVCDSPRHYYEMKECDEAGERHCDILEAGSRAVDKYSEALRNLA
jgi:hypothetical protein